jgi:hypothetical protein
VVLFDPYVSQLTFALHRSEMNDQSLLLRFPGEIRNKIYEYAIGGRTIMPCYFPQPATNFTLDCRPYKPYKGLPNKTAV